MQVDTSSPEEASGDEYSGDDASETLEIENTYDNEINKVRITIDEDPPPIKRRPDPSTENEHFVHSHRHKYFGFQEFR